MDEASSEHISVVLHVLSGLRGARLTFCSGRFQPQHVLLPRQQQGPQQQKEYLQMEMLLLLLLLLPSFSRRSSAAAPGPEQ